MGILLGLLLASRFGLLVFGVVPSALSLKSPGYVARHTPIGYLGSDCGFGQVRIHGFGVERPIWLKRSDGPGQYSRVRHPFLRADRDAGWRQQLVRP